MKPTITIAGAIAQKPRQAGHTWQFMQYLLGFNRLGWDVLFLDQLESNLSVDLAGRPCPIEQSENLRYFLAVMDEFSLQDAFSLIGDHGKHIAGLARPEVLARVKQSAFLLNVMGFLTDEEILAAAPRRVFLDTDPGFGQMWQDLALANLFRGHDDYVTIGENIGLAECTIPTCGLPWLTWRQPVVLDRWPYTSGGSDWAFTSVGAWRGPYAPLEYQGQTYGLRVHEFRKFMAIPRLSGQPFEVALDIHPAEVNDLAQLVENQWRLVEPERIACDPCTYQRYIRTSKAE
ncbi:MAG: hypothetical protein IT328_01730, partial [Caldilineaceae bacterium]|nr:hypothetical protein [Caldilineaceae bacterium]